MRVHGVRPFWGRLGHDELCSTIALKMQGIRMLTLLEGVTLQPLRLRAAYVTKHVCDPSQQTLRAWSRAKYKQAGSNGQPRSLTDTVSRRARLAARA